MKLEIGLQIKFLEKSSILHKVRFIFIMNVLFVGLQRRQRRVLDTSNTYVRGEENLHGWRPQVSIKLY